MPRTRARKQIFDKINMMHKILKRSLSIAEARFKAEDEKAYAALRDLRIFVVE